MAVSRRSGPVSLRPIGCTPALSVTIAYKWRLQDVMTIRYTNSLSIFSLWVKPAYHAMATGDWNMWSHHQCSCDAQSQTNCKMSPNSHRSRRSCPQVGNWQRGCYSKSRNTRLPLVKCALRITQWTADHTMRTADHTMEKLSKKVKSNYFIVRPKVDQRAGLLSLPHLEIFFAIHTRYFFLFFFYLNWFI